MLNATKLNNTLIGGTNRNALNVANSSNRWMTIDSDGNKVDNPELLKQINQGKTVASVADLQQGSYYVHSWAVENASFLRLSNLTLGYTFPHKIIKNWNIKKLRLYFTEIIYLWQLRIVVLTLKYLQKEIILLREWILEPIRVIVHSFLELNITL